MADSSGWQPSQSWSEPVRRRLPVRPSPVFGGMVAIVIAAGVFLWTRPVTSSITSPTRIGIFVFVVTGWVISLCVHEFNHAAVAWKSGDRSVEAKGYLTLDPRRYMNRQLSIVLPIIIVLIGGIGLPGGAVMIDRRFIPGPWRRSLVSAAGPLTNAAFAVACAVPIRLHWVGASHVQFERALAFLALLQVAVTILNSLPIPGLDGFGVLAPHLPDETVRSAMSVANYAFLGLFVLLLYSARASNAFFTFVYRIMAHLGISQGVVEEGRILFSFWRRL